MTDLYDPREQWASFVLNAIKAKELFKREVNYIVKSDEVIIVDEFTGRTMPGRRWSDGLHQAIEAKEGTAIQNETVTLASVSYQNFFRAYPKLSGMSGTASTEIDEFSNIYAMSVQARAAPLGFLLQVVHSALFPRSATPGRAPCRSCLRTSPCCARTATMSCSASRAASGRRC